MKYRKKPVVVEAVQFTEPFEHPEVEQVLKNTESGAIVGYNTSFCEPTVCIYAIKTLEGWYEVSSGDWIVKGVRGEYYPCKPDIFAATYEPVTEFTTNNGE